MIVTWSEGVGHKKPGARCKRGGRTIENPVLDVLEVKVFHELVFELAERRRIRVGMATHGLPCVSDDLQNP